MLTLSSCPLVTLAANISHPDAWHPNTPSTPDLLAWHPLELGALTALPSGVKLEVRSESHKTWRVKLEHRLGKVCLSNQAMRIDREMPGWEVRLDLTPGSEPGR